MSGFSKAFQRTPNFAEPIGNIGDILEQKKIRDDLGKMYNQIALMMGGEQGDSESTKDNIPTNKALLGVPGVGSVMSGGSSTQPPATQNPDRGINVEPSQIDRFIQQPNSTTTQKKVLGGGLPFNKQPDVINFRNESILKALGNKNNMANNVLQKGYLDPKYIDSDAIPIKRGN